MAGHSEALKQILEFNGQKPTYESIKREGRRNIILSVPSNVNSICTILPEEFSTSGVVLVISPYVDRINKQIEYLENLNIAATTITNETSIEDREYIYDNFSHQFFFVTPEMIAKGFEKVQNFIDDLLSSDVSLVVVEDTDVMMNSRVLRESYQVLKGVRTEFPTIPWIALTTGSDMEIRNIASSLSMTNPFVVRLSSV